MERRLAQTFAISATATLAVASVAIAAISGGIFVAAAAPSQPGVKTVEMVDDYIVVHSPVSTSTTTLAPTAVAPVQVAVSTADAFELIVAPASAAVSLDTTPPADAADDPAPIAPATGLPIHPDDDGVEDDTHESDHDDDDAEDESDADRHDDGIEHHSDDEEEDHEADD